MRRIVAATHFIFALNDMARLYIDLLDQLPFSTELTLHIDHMNAGMHLDNGQIFIVWAKVRRRFFQPLGYSEAEGRTTIAGDNMAAFKSEAFVGDILVFHVGTTDFNKYGCDVAWQAFEKISGREVARGKSGFVLLHEGTRMVAPSPEAFETRCKVLEKP